MNRKFLTIVGAGVGLALFLAVARLPSMLYGSYAGTLLAGGIVGTSDATSLLARALVAFGTVLGVVGVAGLFAVAGAVAGAAVDALARAVAPQPQPMAQEQEEQA